MPDAVLHPAPVSTKSRRWRSTKSSSAEVIGSSYLSDEAGPISEPALSRFARYCARSAFSAGRADPQLQFRDVIEPASAFDVLHRPDQIGRASCRERV